MLTRIQHTNKHKHTLSIHANKQTNKKMLDGFNYEFFIILRKIFFFLILIFVGKFFSLLLLRHDDGDVSLIPRNNQSRLFVCLFMRRKLSSPILKDRKKWEISPSIDSRVVWFNLLNFFKVFVFCFCGCSNRLFCLYVKKRYTMIMIMMMMNLTNAFPLRNNV